MDNILKPYESLLQNLSLIVQPFKIVKSDIVEEKQIMKGQHFFRMIGKWLNIQPNKEFQEVVAVGQKSTLI